MSRKLVGVAVLSLVAVSCSGGDDATPGVATLAGTVTTIAVVESDIDTEQQLLTFVQCMRDEGIDLPDPTVSADGNVQLSPPRDFAPGDLEEIQLAADNCDEFLEGIDLGFNNIDLTTITDNLLVFAACMRENGYDIRDPDFSLLTPGSGSFPNAGPFGDLDFLDPDFVAALPACQSLLANLGIANPQG